MNDAPQLIRATPFGDARVPLSILDLATVSSGSTVSAALQASAEVARVADRLGYARLWVAEHHSMPGIASSSPAVVLAYLAAHTERIRLGSGGVMLPNHPPLVVAEQFGTLEALAPGRIDLGLGRAPGTDRATAAALRRHADPGADDFDRQLDELVGFLDDAFPAGHPYSRIHAVPGPIQISDGQPVSRPSVWLLGSSGYSSRLAAARGLPFAFAHHFSAQNTLPALALYREHFTPSEILDRPYSIVAASVVAADTDAEAERLARTMGLAMLKIRTGVPGLMPSPREAEEYSYSPAEREFVNAWLSNVIYGDRDRVRAGIDELIERTGADELMIVNNVYGDDSRRQTTEIVASAYGVV